MSSKRARTVVEEKEEEKVEIVTGRATKKARLSAPDPDDMVELCIICQYGDGEFNFSLFQPGSTPHGKMLKRVFDEGELSNEKQLHAACVHSYIQEFIEEGKKPSLDDVWYSTVPATIRALELVDIGAWMSSIEPGDIRNCPGGKTKFYSVPSDW